MANISERPSDVTASGGIAIAMAELAQKCIGPEGTIVRVPAEDAPMLRTAFISRLAEAAMKILDEDTRNDKDRRAA